MTDTITVADLAIELGVTVRDIARRVSALCHELGPQRVVHTAVASSARSLLHSTAADRIRLDLAAAA